MRPDAGLLPSFRRV